VANSLAYLNKAEIIPVKIFIVQAPVSLKIKVEIEKSFKPCTLNNIFTTDDY
jgi:hypothetical protein